LEGAGGRVEADVEVLLVVVGRADLERLLVLGLEEAEDTAALLLLLVALVVLGRTLDRHQGAPLPSSLALEGLQLGRKRVCVRHGDAAERPTRATSTNEHNKR